jgi:hypothetical protein
MPPVPLPHVHDLPYLENCYEAASVTVTVLPNCLHVGLAESWGTRPAGTFPFSSWGEGQGRRCPPRSSFPCVSSVRLLTCGITGAFPVGIGRRRCVPTAAPSVRNGHKTR